ncbi:MAG: DUF4129 domain-containing protein [Saprospiraceae bacterium]|nr:DUF4129 domain-containing protein [Saprospiraceae bacterium]
MKHMLLFLLFPLSLFAQIEETLGDTLQEIEMAADTAYLEEEIIEEEFVREPYNAPPLAPLALREVPADKWDKASGGMDYSKDVPKPPIERKKRDPNEPSPSFDWTGLTQGLGVLLQMLAVIFALGVIGYGIYWMMQAPRNRTISRDGTEITLANLDEYIHETDLERFLREALAASNWPLAVRLYFLQTIKQLSEKEAIVWSKEKTNRDYLREMRGHRLGPQFRDVTRQYERVWYGNQPLAAEEFARLEPELKGLLGEI